MEDQPNRGEPEEVETALTGTETGRRRSKRRDDREGRERDVESRRARRRAARGEAAADAATPETADPADMAEATESDTPAATDATPEAASTEAATPDQPSPDQQAPDQPAPDQPAPAALAGTGAPVAQGSRNRLHLAVPDVPPAPAEGATIVPLKARRDKSAPAAAAAPRAPAVTVAPPQPDTAPVAPVPSPAARPAKPSKSLAAPVKAPPVAPSPVPIVPLAGPARLRSRHVWIILSFIGMVVLPALATAWYLWLVAIDQYDSRVGFSVQREEAGSAVEFLGGITELTGSSSSDTDILYKFIQSRELIRILDDRLDLVSMFTRPEDPVFSLGADPTIEDLENVWARKVDVFYDNASYLIEVRVLAFRPEDAQAIADGIFAESTRMLNQLSAAARADKTRYARDELEVAKARLKDARQALTAFRVRSQIVDPAADVQGRMGLLNNLLSQKATALIELDLLATNSVAPSDPRYQQAQKRVEVIENRLREERARFGDNPAEEDERYADLVAEYEELSADVEFAQQAYLTSLAAYDAAVAEAQRTSRYLATYLPTTLAERSDFPQRGLILAMMVGLFFAVWAISVLTYYTLRDRV